MTGSTHTRIPGHLRRYIVDQDYSRYTPEDQAVWRYIMRQLKNFLALHAHESYLEGLKKTGIAVDHIPVISDIDRHLERFGWGAVPVSGFIPPAAFMELQSIGILPIACDMRTLAHLQYTPAPDIVHEAAGHAPILANPEYAAYLRQYGKVARQALISKEDIDQYEAIRILSDVKEDPRSTPDEIALAERRLSEVTASMAGVSEAALLSRMNWWTAEYGLIGDIKAPRIFGAGLLSSVGESRSCLSERVKKLPLSVACIDYAYDITEPQPQLFVAKDFSHLSAVLEELAGQLAFRRGGAFGLKRAREAATVNTVQLNSGLQMSGRLDSYLLTDDGRPAHVRFEGPCQLAAGNVELSGHGPGRHAHGFSTPIGRLAGESRCLSDFTPEDLRKIGLEPGRRATLKFASGVVVEGHFLRQLYLARKLAVLTFAECRVSWGTRTLFDPAWGEFDMGVGFEVVSVFGGPADRSAFPETQNFAAKRVPTKTYSPDGQRRHAFFQAIRELRERAAGAESEKGFRRLLKQHLENPEASWLAGVELMELSHLLGLPELDRTELRERLMAASLETSEESQSLRDGLELADRRL